MAGMSWVRVGDGVFEVEVRGAGETVVFLHGSSVADTFAPVVRAPALDGYRLVRYRRRGYGRSGPRSGPVGVVEHAADCRALLAELAVTRAHLVGHSFGCTVALQVALDAPDLVRSLVLLDPAIFTEEDRGRLRAVLGAFAATYADGDAAAAVEGFWTLVGGRDWRAQLGAVVPRAPEQAVADAPALFESDIPGAAGWSFGGAQAARINHPVLHVVGGDSLPAFHAARDLLRSWLPWMESAVLPGTNHLLPVQQPAQVADLIAEHIARLAPSSGADAEHGSPGSR